MGQSEARIRRKIEQRMKRRQEKRLAKFKKEADIHQKNVEDQMLEGISTGNKDIVRKQLREYFENDEG